MERLGKHLNECYFLLKRNKVHWEKKVNFPTWKPYLNLLEMSNFHEFPNLKWLEITNFQKDFHSRKFSGNAHLHFLRFPSEKIPHFLYWKLTGNSSFLWETTCSRDILGWKFMEIVVFFMGNDLFTGHTLLEIHGNIKFQTFSSGKSAYRSDTSGILRYHKFTYARKKLCCWNKSNKHCHLFVNWKDQKRPRKMNFLDFPMV